MNSSRSSGRFSEAVLVPPATPRAPGLAVELIGPAAAGKSTVARHLWSRAEARRPLALWGLPRTKLAAHGLRLLPRFVELARDARPPALRQLVQMVRLDTLHEVLARRRASSHAILLLDEGPVFALSWKGAS